MIDALLEQNNIDLCPSFSAPTFLFLLDAHLVASGELIPSLLSIQSTRSHTINSSLKMVSHHKHLQSKCVWCSHDTFFAHIKSKLKFGYPKPREQGHS